MKKNALTAILVAALLLTAGCGKTTLSMAAV